MANATLKIKLRNGTIETFSEPVGKSNDVDYEEMDKALHRLQEKSNALLTVHVEKEKEINKMQQKDGSETAEAMQDNDDEEESTDDDEEDENDEDGKPPEKKLKT